MNAHSDQSAFVVDRAAAALMDQHSSQPAGTAWANAGEVTRDRFREEVRAVIDAYRSALDEKDVAG